MEFRVLGPLEVSHGGEPVSVGGPQRRALLALLLTHVNEAVSADYLIDQLWGEDPPTAARKSLQSHVANLRNVLNVDGDVLWAQPPGYVLSLQPTQLDALRFENLLRQAGSKLDIDPEQASKELDEALALWRGNPFADVADESPTLRADAARLSELRLTAREHRIQVELALGGHTGVIPELERLTDQYPLREALWARLMLALYRSGRQADALATYQKARRLLAEELGIEPSLELQQLEEQMLLHAPELGWTPPTDTPQQVPEVLPSPLPSPDQNPSNLPASLSSFVGRGAEIAKVTELVSGARLVTLTGAGGSGKTRLALQVAGEMAGGFPDGVWFVGLAGLSDPDLLAREVAGALTLKERPGQAWLDVISSFLSERNLLLVLDNCEHLVDAVARLTLSLLEAAPGLQVLATSREPLGMPGEMTWLVPLMALPPLGGDASIEELLEFEAVQLFVQRATTARPDVEFGDEDAVAIAQICRRLDGLPLAMELAAARVRAMSVHEIADHLDDRFALLAGGHRAQFPRQQTLEATVSWSYDLIKPEEQRLFNQLSVFSGGFDLDAADEVAGAVALAGVTSLVEKSLLVAKPKAVQTRYQMLETVAAFGLMKLGEEDARSRDAHLAWAVKLARTAAASLEGTQQAVWIDRIDTELDNVRAAMQWALDTGDLAAGMVIASSLFNYWYMRGVREGHSWIEQFLAENPEVSDEVMGWALFTGGALLHQEGEHESERAAELLEASLLLFQAIGDEHGIAYSLHHLARTHWGRVDPEQLRVELETALDGFRRVEDHVGVATSLMFIVWLELENSDPVRAVEVADELFPLTERIGSPNIMAHGHELSATARWHVGNFEGAGPLLHEALKLYRRVGNTQCSAHCLESVAAWLLGKGDPETATLIVAATDSLRSDIGVRAPRWERPIPEGVRAGAEAALGGEAFAEAWRQGQVMTLEAARDTAIAATSAGGLVVRDGVDPSTSGFSDRRSTD